MIITPIPSIPSLAIETTAEGISLIINQSKMTFDEANAFLVGQAINEALQYAIQIHRNEVKKIQDAAPPDKDATPLDKA